MSHTGRCVCERAPLLDVYGRNASCNSSNCLLVVGGLPYLSRKGGSEWKRFLSIRLSNDHSSLVLFCMGVPVSKCIWSTCSRSTHREREWHSRSGQSVA